MKWKHPTFINDPVQEVEQEPSTVDCRLERTTKQPVSSIASKENYHKNMFGNGDDAAEFLIGESARLDPLRSALATTNEETVERALKQLLDEGEHVLLPFTLVRVTLQTASDDGDENDNDAANHFENIKGHLLITSEKVLFVDGSSISNTTTNDNNNSTDNDNKNNAAISHHNHDLSIDAECIQLHAQASEPVSVYLQIGDDSSDDSTPPKEVVILPCNDRDDDDDDDTNAELFCQELFLKLSKLISLHPISPNEGSGGGEQGGSMMGLMSTMGMMGVMASGGGGGDALNGFVTSDNIHELSSPVSGTGGGVMDDDSDDDDMIVAAPSAGAGDHHPHQFDDVDDSDSNDEGGATSEERAAMLERLDEMLTVKPGLEISEGQFADADEELEDISPQAKVNNKTKEPTNYQKGQFDDAENDDALDPLL